MSEPMKKHPTNSKVNRQVILHFVHNGHVYHIPKTVAEQYEEKSKSSSKSIVDKVPAENVFKKLEKKFTKAGMLLQGTRHREGLTQSELAKMMEVTQADLSKMENGKRPIGKKMAKRIEKLFGINYRYFL
jgi:ribosome-binding protein aMBF1 (putative translation factor)